MSKSYGCIRNNLWYDWQMLLDLEKSESLRAWKLFGDLLEAHKLKWNRGSSSASPIPTLTDRMLLRKELAQFDLEVGCDLEQLLRWVSRGLDLGVLHSGSENTYGVFNPRPNEVGVLAESLSALYNPQLASTVSAPFPIDVEQFLIQEFAKKFSFSQFEGTFTSGGTEANFTALVSALNYRFPEFKKSGVFGLSKRPLIYVSSESHHSILRGLQLTGLGTDCLVEVPVRSDLKMDTGCLESILKDCDLSKNIPLMVVGTLGTTNSGTIDCLEEIATLSKRFELWFHLDAAWGGAAVILPEMASFFKGCNLADSLTLDAHKWLQIPMTAGMFICQKPGSLQRAFQVENTYYMPKQTLDSEAHEPYRDSFGWSRRFRGLKLFMSLANFGWGKYRDSFRYQIELGKYLKLQLENIGMKILNDTPLPVVCFLPVKHDWSVDEVSLVQKRLADLGIWLTTVRIGAEKTPALRIGINHPGVSRQSLDRLVRELRSIM